MISFQISDRNKLLQVTPPTQNIMSKVLHLNTPASSESTILSAWSSTSSISTLSSVAAASTPLDLSKSVLQPMLRAGTLNEMLESGPFQREQRIAEMVLNHPDIATTSSGKPQIVFIHKLYDMLGNESISHLIRWAPDSISFYVFPGENFCKVLAQYFKHTNVSSFIRQLNMYGFHKVSDNNTSSSETKDNSRWEFRHSQNYFKKGDIESLKFIKRKSSKPVVNVQKEVVDLKTIPHPNELNLENEHSPFNTHFSTPSPSQAPVQYAVYPYQMPQTPQFAAPASQPLQLHTQHVERTPPKLKSPLTSFPPVAFNQMGPDATLPLPQALQNRPQEYIHQRPPIAAQYSFEDKPEKLSEVEFWKRKHAELNADYDALVGIVERGTNVDIEYQKFKKHRSNRQQLHLIAPQADKTAHLTTYYPQYKPKFNPPIFKQRPESNSYSPLNTTTAQKEYFLHKQEHQLVSMDSKIPTLMVPQTQRTNSLPGDLQESGMVSPMARVLTGKRNSDSLISAPKLPSVNELTMSLPVFNPNVSKRKRSE